MKLSHIGGILSWEGKGLMVASCPLDNPEGSQGQLWHPCLHRDLHCSPHPQMWFLQDPEKCFWSPVPGRLPGAQAHIPHHGSSL